MRHSLRMVARELTPSRWMDLEKLFARHGGVYGGCWCMYYHIASGWEKRTPQQNRGEKKALVEQGKAHGALVYSGGEPIGWCQFGSRNELPRIEKIKRYAKLQCDPDMWRITCFFVDTRFRRRGVARFALKAAIRFMKQQGVKLIEAYPVSVSHSSYPSSRLWFGTLKLFLDAGFKIVGYIGKNKPVVRLGL